MQTILLLVASNIFMTLAWYGHLKFKWLDGKSLLFVILVSWGIAFFEYCLLVPANRIGYNYFTLSQLKIIQEVLTMVVFVGFLYFYMKLPITKNLIYATICLVLEVFFIFKDVCPAAR